MSSPTPTLRVGAYAVCLRDGAVLLARLIGADPPLWTLPGGGLDHGEDPRDGASRELTEETGLSGTIVELLDVDSWHELWTNLAGEPEDYHGIRILFRCRIVGGELRDATDGSTDTCRWFARSELPADRLVDIAELAVRLVL